MGKPRQWYYLIHGEKGDFEEQTSLDNALSYLSTGFVEIRVTVPRAYLFTVVDDLNSQPRQVWQHHDRIEKVISWRDVQQ